MQEPSASVAVMVVALVALAVATGPTATAATAGDTAIVRQTEALEIRFSEGTFTENMSTVQVTVKGESVRTKKMNASSNPRIRIPLTDGELQAFDDLRDAEVVVMVDETQVANRSLSLVYVEFDDTKDPILEEGAIKLHTNHTVGVPTGGTVRVTVDGAAGSGTVSAKVPETGVEISVTDIRDVAGIFEPVSFTPRTTSYELGPELAGIDVTKLATTAGGLDGETLTLENPLIRKNTEYTVQITGDGRFVRTMEASSSGALSFPAPGLVGATESIQVTVWEGDQELASVSGVNLYDQNPVQGAIVSDGSGFFVQRVVRNIDRVFISTADELIVARVRTADIEGGTTTITLDDATLDASNQVTAVIQTGSGPVVAELAPASGDNEAGVGGQNAETSPGNDSTAEDGGFIAKARNNVGILAAIFAGLLVLLAGVYVATRRRESSRETNPGFSNAQASVGGTNTVEVPVVSASTMQRITEPVTVELQNLDRHETTETKTTEDGSVRFDGVPTGRFRVRTTDGRATEDFRIHHHGSRSQIRLELPAQKSVVRVVNTQTEQPIPGAQVSASDGTLSGNFVNDDGQVGVQFPHGTDQITITVSHDGYEDGSVRVAPEQQQVLQLAPKTGTLTVEVDIDSRPIPGVPVEAIPMETLPGHDTEPTLETTDESGTVVFREVPIGEYRTGIEFPGDDRYFDVDSDTAVVQQDGTVTSRIGIRFTYTLPERIRSQIGNVKNAVGKFRTVSNRDTVIPQYYGSVIETALETAQTVPSNGHLFATADVTPDEVVSATIDAAERCASIVRNAMTTKRNADLFRACQDLGDRPVEWQGTIEVEALLTWATMDDIKRRQRIGDRLEAVGDRIDSERNNVATPDPASDLWEEVRNEIRNTGTADPVDEGVFDLLALQLVDAAEQLFDEPALRERLERTVF